MVDVTDLVNEGKTAVLEANFGEWLPDSAYLLPWVELEGRWPVSGKELSIRLWVLADDQARGFVVADFQSGRVLAFGKDCKPLVALSNDRRLRRGARW